MPKKDLPRFVIYQPNQKEFHICLQLGERFLRWCSYYSPSLDVRFPRELTRIDDLPAKNLPKKNIFDQGTFTITKLDTKETIAKKLAEGIKSKNFSFIFEGTKLKGRFSLKSTPRGALLQKYKDKYAVEEDVLSGDLSRTISTMIPDYDERKVRLAPAGRSKKAAGKEKELSVEEEITADKKIGNTIYHFAFYRSGHEPDICLATSGEGEVLVLKKQGRRWVLSPAAGAAATAKEQEFIRHAKALESAMS